MEVPFVSPRSVSSPPFSSAGIGSGGDAGFEDDAPQEHLPNLRRPKVLGRGADTFGPGREIAALLLWGTALFVGLALGSYREPDGANWVGPVGEGCARTLAHMVGVMGWAIPFELTLLGFPFVRGRRSEITPARIAGDLLIVVFAAALLQVGGAHAMSFDQHPLGGIVGELFGELARSLFSTVGSYLVGFALIGLILVGRASFSFIALVYLVARIVHRITLIVASGADAVVGAWRTARSIDNAPPQTFALDVVSHADPGEMGDGVEWALACGVQEALAELAPPDAMAGGAKRRSRKRKDSKDAAVDAPAAVALRERAETPTPPAAIKVEPTIVDTRAALATETRDPGDVGRSRDTVRGSSKGERSRTPHRPFRLPDIEFLVPSNADANILIDRETLLKNAELLIKTLADYGVLGKVEDILPGPTVTTYEVSPASGTKVSKVASLADDLALALARKVRIIAPIPGKNRIGFELPNERRVPVTLRDLVEDRRFRTLDVPLPVVLGRDILGNPVYADLASMPHVIVAGATGAGKSVGLNVMLTSLLYRRSPEELRLLMIDPKVVELAPFDRIPHMLLPVVTDMKQASTALKWAVDEMERRYQLFADAGTKNIGTYNNWVVRVQKGEIRNPAPRTVLARDHNGLPEAIPPEAGEEGEAALPDKLPLIVIVVDEFADLMMQQGKEVEVAVARLAQKARAAGMHVIVATQRPSVDVITGMIKANFPTRIAYRVAQKVDSRTILDEQGAEHLLGRGDMLIKLNGTNETKRVQCPWVSEEEVQTVTDYLRSQGEPVYDENILKPRDEDGVPVEEDAEADSLYDDAVRIVAETRRCSTSWLQRKLGLGYNRAARIVEMMEKRGLVGPANGAKDREVLVESH